MESIISIGIALGGLLVLWIITSLLVGRSIKEPGYKMVAQTDGYEVREYKPYLLATVVVTGEDQSQMASVAFRKLAGYIFGGNRSQTSIEMTAPVQTSPVSEKIEMTAPVLTQGGNLQLKMSFVLPERFTLENAPEPLSDDVALSQKEGGLYAVCSFSGFTGEDRVTRLQEEFQTLLQADSITTHGEIELLRYNQPWIFPWVRRNELRVSIAQ